jgi:Flp pilus assembly protein TadG
MCRESAAIPTGRRGQRQGFVLVTMAIAAIALIAVLGLAVDVGRMFIAKNETQTYCDSASLAAALALDGTTTGIA